VYTPSRGKTRIYPGWYYISTLVNRLGKYQADSIVREEGDVWIYRYRHKEFADSLACFIYKPTANGSRINAFRMEIGNTINQVAKVSFSDSSDQGTMEVVKVTDGKISIDIQEKPTLILYKQPNTEK
jgi:hypothetical protein